MFESRLTLTQYQELTKVLIFLVYNSRIFTAYVFYSLRLFKLISKGQTIQTENLTEEVYKTQIKFRANPAWVSF